MKIRKELAPPPQLEYPAFVKFGTCVLACLVYMHVHAHGWQTKQRAYTCNACRESLDFNCVPSSSCAMPVGIRSRHCLWCLASNSYALFWQQGNSQQNWLASNRASLRALRSRVHSTSSKKIDEHWRPQKWQKPKLPSLAVRWEQDVNTVDSIPHTAKHTESIMRWIEVRTKTWSWARRGALLLAALPL